MAELVTFSARPRSFFEGIHWETEFPGKWAKALLAAHGDTVAAREFLVEINQELSCLKPSSRPNRSAEATELVALFSGDKRRFVRVASTSGLKKAEGLFWWSVLQKAALSGGTSR